MKIYIHQDLSTEYWNLADIVWKIKFIIHARDYWAAKFIHNKKLQHDLKEYISIATFY